MSLGLREPRAAVRVSRTRRSQARSRRRQWIGLGVVIAVLVGFGLFSFLLPGGSERAAPVHSPKVSPKAVVAAGEVDSLLLSVRGGREPLLAVIGSGSAPAILPIPGSLTVEAPGLGQTSMAGVGDLPGDPMRVAVSNTLGMWVDHYAVTDVRRLGAIASRTGGLTLVLPQAVTVGDRVFGPGQARMGGADLARYLSVPGAQGAERWDVVLTALVSSPPALQSGDLIEADGLAGVQQILGSARDADILSFPSEIVGGTVRVPMYEDLDALMAHAFGTSGRVVRVIVQNGSGAPNVSETVARRLVPLGFRVVLSTNADRFDTKTTQVIAMSQDDLEAASSAQQALGVGTVGLSRIPSGVGDITIVVGRDLSS
ncbi:MAG: LytR C-terminal domain-containing protein [Actinobacteria bacterium]|nr:LytR C-terminal domain-containing protein [Actinomycetota bacterium]